MQVNRYYFFILCVLFSPLNLADETSPSLDFLEYLGEFETELNGEIINPMELDLIANNTATGEETEDE